MALLILHKTGSVPTGPAYGANAMFMVSEDNVHVPHRAWRINVSSIGDIETNKIQLDEIIIAEGDGSGTPFDSDHGVGNEADGLFDGTSSEWWQCSVTTLPQHAGKIYDVPQTWNGISLTSKSGDKPDDFKIQYSDDTTDGTDGTWVDHGNFTGQAAGWADGADLALTINPPSGNLSLHFTNTAGDKLHQGVTHTYVSEQLAKGILEDGHLPEVADITTRDALTLTSNTYVLVLDASDDVLVTTGWGLYDYDLSTDVYTLIHAENNGLALTQSDW